VLASRGRILQKRVALITGGNGGIGLGMAKRKGAALGRRQRSRRSEVLI